MKKLLYPVAMLTLSAVLYCIYSKAPETTAWMALVFPLMIAASKHNDKKENP